MQIAITFRTHQFLGDRFVETEFPISINPEKDIHESLLELVKRIESHYLPILRDEAEYEGEKPNFKLTDEIIIKLIK